MIREKLGLLECSARLKRGVEAVQSGAKYNTNNFACEGALVGETTEQRLLIYGAKRYPELFILLKQSD